MRALSGKMWAPIADEIVPVASTIGSVKLSSWVPGLKPIGVVIRFGEPSALPVGSAALGGTIQYCPSVPVCVRSRSSAVVMPKGGAAGET